MDTVSTEELERMRENNEDFKLVDVLGEDHYEEGHIPGAMNIPLDRIEEVAENHLDRNDNIVVYCASESCGASEKALKKLEDLGFTNVKDYEVGLKGWKDSGHSTA